MRVVVFTGSRELSQNISLVLKMRWPELSLIEVSEAREAIELIHRQSPHVVILHFHPDAGDCPDLISQIRSFSDVPIIVLSKSQDVMDKVRVLEMGADDWIDPSSVPMEFIAKVNAILRRCPPTIITPSPLSSVAD